MKFPSVAIAVCAAILIAACEAAGGDFTVGFDAVICEGGSKTAVSVPFRRLTSHSGTVSGAPAVNAGSATLTAGGSPAFPAGEFTNEAHYLLFTGSGDRAGSIFPVTAHDATTITIDLDGDDLTGVAHGDSFEVVPYWTLETLFPSASQVTIRVSTSQLAEDRRTEVVIPGPAGDQTYFLTAVGWFLSDAGFPAADDVTIPPQKVFVIRHPAGEADTTFYAHQVVFDGSQIGVTDATVGKSLTTQKGDGKYNSTGAGQKLKQVSKKGKKLKFLFKVQNDSDYHDTISLTTTPKDKFFRAKYFRISGPRTNVTAALKRDDYQKVFAGRTEETFQLDVKPSRKAVRMKKTFTIDANSLAGSTDRVKAEVKAK